MVEGSKVCHLNRVYRRVWNMARHELECSWSNCLHVIRKSQKKDTISFTYIHFKFCLVFFLIYPLLILLTLTIFFSLLSMSKKVFFLIGHACSMCQFYWCKFFWMQKRNDRDNAQYNQFHNFIVYKFDILCAMWPVHVTFPFLFGMFTLKVSLKQMKKVSI
jgi:hypothetical protein